MSWQDLDMSSLNGITHDSRQVRDGYLFAALPGQRHDGQAFIGDAVRAGATHILAAPGTAVPEGAVLIADDNPRRALAQIAAAFYKDQPGHCAAVTGTNGKTSVAEFTGQIWKALGKSAATIGTLGVRMPGNEGGVRSGSMTTPDPVALMAELADLAAAGITHLAMEASSHGLDQYRLDGVRVQAAAFTNFSHDHLDYHNTVEAYFAAKARLFEEALLPEGTAVLNADVPEYEDLKKIAKKRGVKTISYGYDAQDLFVQSREPTPAGQAVRLSIAGQSYDLTLPLVGDFQLMNALCALGLVMASGDTDFDYAEALQRLQGVPGRLQLVAGHPRGAAAYVDYAHTPDALETVLAALRPHVRGKLICVFGCGGDRDRAKRPLMGRIAGQSADHVIVTDDNPRSEDPAAIRAEILAGVTDAVEIGGRREAIRAALADAQAGDVVLLAGKGHERGQVFATRTEDFHDEGELKKAMEEL